MLRNYKQNIAKKNIIITIVLEKSYDMSFGKQNFPKLNRCQCSVEAYAYHDVIT